MVKLTPDQIREIRNELMETIRSLNNILNEQGDDLRSEEIQEINRAGRQLSNAVTELTADAISGTAAQLKDAVSGLKKATKNANDALDTLDNIRSVIKVATSLVNLGLAVASGNPGGIIKAAGNVISTVNEARNS